MHSVEEMRYGIGRYQGRVAKLNYKYGENLRRKNFLLKVLEILEKLRPLKYLGADNKQDVLMLLDTIVKDDSIDFVEVSHLQIIKKCLASLG